MKRQVDRVVRAMVLVSMSVLLAEPAFAQNLEAKIQNLGDTVITLLQGVAVVVGTAATLMVGMKFTWGDHHAKEGAKSLVIGAIFSFGAVAIMQTMRSALS